MHSLIALVLSAALAAAPSLKEVSVEISDLSPSASRVHDIAAETLVSPGKNEKNWFRSYTIRKDDPVYNRIEGKSFSPLGKVRLEDLRYVKVLHYDFDGKIRTGEIIVNRRIAETVKTVFYQLYKEKYPVRSMFLVDRYWVSGKDGNAADYRSVEADNTSAFNYRKISHRNTLSNHAEGFAVDLNPRENPYVGYSNGRAYAIDHPGLNSYASGRSASEKYMITRKDAAYRIFTSHGFIWGGSWSSTPDYQHFEKVVR